MGYWLVIKNGLWGLLPLSGLANHIAVGMATMVSIAVGRGLYQNQYDLSGLWLGGFDIVK